MYKIEKGVPLKLHVTKGRSKYPFAAMKVGDSFFVPKSQLKVPSPLYTISGRMGIEVRVGRVHNGKGAISGHRVWRIK